MALVYFYPVMYGELIGQTDFYYFISPWNQFRPADLISMSNSALRDQSTEFLPFFLEAKSQLVNGLLPLWNPYIFVGTPLLANMQSALFFPLNFAHYLFAPAVGYTFSALFKLILSAFFTYIYARKMCLSHVAALLAGTVFAYAMFNIFWLNHPHTNATLLLPLSLYCAERFLTQCSKKTVLLFALVISATLFSGHVEIAFIIALATALYLCVRSLQTHKLTARLVYLFFASYLLACLLSAVLILPFIEFLYHSATWSERAKNTLPAMPWGNIMTLFLGKIFVAEGWDKNIGFAHSVNFYISIVVLPLIVLAIRFNLKQALAFVLLAAVAILSVFDIFSFQSLLLLIPIVKQTPLFYFVVFWLIAAGMLAGIGFDVVCKNPSMLKPLLLTTAIIVILMAIFVWYWEADYYLQFVHDHTVLMSQKFKLAGLATLLLLSLAFAMSQYQRHKNTVAGLVVLLVFVDLMWVGQSWNPTIKKQHSFIPDNNEISEFFQQTQQPFRVLSLDNILLSSSNMLIKMADIQGYDVPVSRRYHQFFKQALQGTDYYWQYSVPEYKTAILPFLQILNVTHVLSNSKQLDLPLVQAGAVNIYQIPQAKPRAFMQYQWINADDAEQALKLVMENKNKLHDTLILENNDNNSSVDSNSSHAIEFYSHTSQKIKLKVNTQAAGYLVLSQSYYPGWKAYVDNQPVPIYPADYLLQAIKLPKGEHQVKFVYWPLSFWFGFGMSLISLIGVLWSLKRK